MTQSYKNHSWLSERVILGTKNEDVIEINCQMTTYESIDSVID